MMKVLNCFALTLGIIGALNWGLLGLLDVNLVEFLFGTASVVSRAIYVLVGLSGLYMLLFYSKVSRDF